LKDELNSPKTNVRKFLESIQILANAGECLAVEYKRSPDSITYKDLEVGNDRNIGMTSE
jgi:hypothetical protein